MSSFNPLQKAAKRSAARGRKFDQVQNVIASIQADNAKAISNNEDVIQRALVVFVGQNEFETVSIPGNSPVLRIGKQNIALLSQDDKRILTKVTGIFKGTKSTFRGRFDNGIISKLTSVSCEVGELVALCRRYDVPLPEAIQTLAEESIGRNQESHALLRDGEPLPQLGR